MIDEEKLQQNALDVGTFLLKGFESLRDKYDVIGDVRGKVRKFNPLLIPLHPGSFSTRRLRRLLWNSDQTSDY